MTIDNNIRDKKLQYKIVKQAVKILALSSGKVDQQDYLPSEEILPLDQSRKLFKDKYKQLKIKQKNKLKLWKF